MPDEFDTLREVEVSPLPVAAARARGDHLRRRRNGLTVLGAVASVLLVAGLTGALRSADSPPSPAPAPEPVVTSIPDDFPLAAGLPRENEDGSPVEVLPTSPVEALGVCEREVWASSGARDVAGVQFSQPEDLRQRILLLFDTSAEASDRLARARDAVAACPVEAVGGTDWIYAALDDRSGEESFAFTREYRTGGTLNPGLDVYHFVRVGNALLFTASSGEASSTAAANRAARTLAEAMTVFAGPTAAGWELSSDIPADFPLDHDQEAMKGNGEKMLGPSADAPGLDDQELCGISIWTLEPTDRLAATVTGREYADRRELRVFATADVAVREMTALRSHLRDCHDESVVGGGRLVYATFDVAVGYEALTFGSYYTQGLGGGPVQVVRVGRGIVAIGLSDEFSEDTLPAGVDDVTGRMAPIIPAMCAFTEAGCAG